MKLTDDPPADAVSDLEETEQTSDSYAEEDQSSESAGNDEVDGSGESDVSYDESDEIDEYTESQTTASDDSDADWEEESQPDVVIEQLRIENKALRDELKDLKKYMGKVEEFLKSKGYVKVTPD